MANFSFDCDATSQIGDQFWRQAASCAADQHAGLEGVVTSIATINHGEVGALVGQDLHLLQGVAVVRVGWKAAHAHMSFVFLSNHDDAVHFDTHNRRYFVAEIKAEPLVPQFYDEYAKWRDGGRLGRAALSLDQ